MMDLFYIFPSVNKMAEYTAPIHELFDNSENRGILLLEGSDDMLKESKIFEVEAGLYNQADVVLKGLGMSMPEAITEYLEQIVSKKTIQKRQIFPLHHLQ